MSMAGTKRAAPSESSSPEPGVSKRARIDQNDETKAKHGQGNKADEPQQEDITKHQEEARDHQELRVKEELCVEEEADEDPELRAINIIDEPKPVVLAHNNHDPSFGLSQEENNEDFPQTHLELQEMGEQDEKATVEDEAAINRVKVPGPAPKNHDISSNSSSKTSINKRAQMELMVEIETYKELILNETQAATSAIVPYNVADGLFYDPRVHDPAAQETIMASVELVELTSEAPLSIPADPSTEAFKFTDRDAVGTADSKINSSIAQLLAIRARSPKSTTPSQDPRIALWKDERRSFAGSITIDRDRATAARIAHMASQTSLFNNGVPHLKFFGDGSIKNGSSSSRPEHGWTIGGYRVAFRNPFDDTVQFVSRDENPIRFLEHPSVKAYQQGVDNDYVLEEEGEIYEGPSRLVDFTILCFGVKKAFSVPQLELAAISQALETMIQLSHEHQPPTSDMTIFSDSRCAIERVMRGVVTGPPGAKLTLWSKLSNPLVQTIIWQSHYLQDHGCQVTLAWSPRCSSLGPSIADAAASAWKEWPELEKTEWSQRSDPLDIEDSIMDKLNEATKKQIRGYEA